MKKTQSDHIDYGIYIDYKKAYIVSVNEFDREQPASIQVEVNDEMEFEKAGAAKTTHGQNRYNEQVKKYCKAVIVRLEHPHRIVVFGPSEAKYELHKELQQIKAFEQIPKEVLVTDQMETEAQAGRFTEKHFATRNSL